MRKESHRVVGVLLGVLLVLLASQAEDTPHLGLLASCGQLVCLGTGDGDGCVEHLFLMRTRAMQFVSAYKRAPI
jgi:hypothetical protein